MWEIRSWLRTWNLNFNLHDRWGNLKLVVMLADVGGQDADYPRLALVVNRCNGAILFSDMYCLYI